MHDNENITSTVVETTTTPTETQFVPLSVLTEVQARLEGTAANLAYEKTKQRQFKQQVREVFIELVGEGDLARDKANEVLENLGLEKLVRKWTVSASFNDTTVLVVSGIEAEDDDDAIQDLRDNLSCSAQAASIEYSVDYNGSDGTVEANDSYTELYPDEDENLAEYFLDNLEFSAEEDEA